MSRRGAVEGVGCIDWVRRQDEARRTALLPGREQPVHATALGFPHGGGHVADFTPNAEEAAMNADAITSRRVVTTVRGMRASDGAGVKLNRLIGQPALDMLDPFHLRTTQCFT